MPRLAAVDATPTLRIATLDDDAAIEALMKASIRDIFPAFYDAAQSAASVEHVGHVDRTLLADGTYFVIEADGELVACGGWSRRDKLYTGSGDAEGDSRLLDPATEPARVRAMFTRPDWTRRGLGRRILEACEAAALAEGFTTLALMATLPGVLLYEKYGFERVEDAEVTMPDGTTVAAVSMRMAIPRTGG
jgi:GNAT superfamily N-acetyltransferase